MAQRQQVQKADGMNQTLVLEIFGDLRLESFQVGENVAVGDDHAFGLGGAAGSEYDLNHVAALKRRRSVGRAGAASNQLRDGLQFESGNLAELSQQLVRA